MTHHHTLHSLFVFLLPTTLFAQHDAATITTYPPLSLRYDGAQSVSAQDSVSLIRFTERLEQEDDTSHVFTQPGDHRMTWHDSRHGGWWMAFRGDGRTLAAFMSAPSNNSPLVSGMSPSAQGWRCMVVVRDVPRGLIDRDVWYFEAP